VGISHLGVGAEGGDPDKASNKTDSMNFRAPARVAGCFTSRVDALRVSLGHHVDLFARSDRYSGHGTSVVLTFVRAVRMEFDQLAAAGIPKCVVHVHILIL